MFPPSPPVFLVGCPRSGTSVTKKVLRRHPGLASCGVEHPYILELFDHFGAVIQSANEALMVFAQSSGSFGPEFIAGARRHFEGREEPIPVADFCAELWKLATPEHGGRPFLLQESGDGIIRSSKLLDLFPGARFVVLTRDPRANVSSQLLSLDRGRTTNRSINLWKECRVAAERLIRSHPTAAIDVPYEGLVNDTEKWLRAIVEFLELPWDGSLLEFDVPMSVMNVDGTVEHRRFSEFDTAMLDKWRTALSDGQVALIERRCRAEMERLGYERSGRELSVADIPFVSGDVARWAGAWVRAQSLQIRRRRHGTHNSRSKTSVTPSGP